MWSAHVMWLMVAELFLKEKKEVVRNFVYILWHGLSPFSWSPQNLNQRMDVFYLQPERSSSADSPVWYTSASLDRNTLENMLVRVLLVKDIYDKDNYELDEDTE